MRAQDNYLACSLETRSEVVVLIRDRGEVIGQFDIDSDNVGEFGARDTELLEGLAAATSAGRVRSAISWLCNPTPRELR